MLIGRRSTEIEIVVVAEAKGSLPASAQSSRLSRDYGFSNRCFRYPKRRFSMSSSRRGGFRPNWILQYGARVSCSGRRGRRRVRVSQCYALRVEDVYTELVRQGVDLDPGWCRKVRITLGSRVFQISLECRANRIWRIGRPFFQCPRCQVPMHAAVHARCRRRGP